MHAITYTNKIRDVKKREIFFFFTDEGFNSGMVIVDNKRNLCL